MKVKKALEALILTGILVLFLGMTDPGKIPLYLVLVPYILCALIIYRAVLILLRFMLNRSINNSKLRLYSLIITSILVNFALLKSIGQITVQDTLISLAIMVVSVVYISKFSFN